MARKRKRSPRRIRGRNGLGSFGLTPPGAWLSIEPPSGNRGPLREKDPPLSRLRIPWKLIAILGAVGGAGFFAYKKLRTPK